MNSTLVDAQPGYELFRTEDVYAMVEPTGEAVVELGEVLISEEVLAELPFWRVAPLVIEHEQRKTASMRSRETKELLDLAPHGFHFSVHESSDPYCRLWITTEPPSSSEFRSTTVELARL